MDRRKALEILGLSENASENEIKKAYHTLCFKHHTDKSSKNKEKIQEINEANTFLKNEKEKSKPEEPEKITCYYCKERYEDGPRWITISRDKQFCSIKCWNKWKNIDNGKYLDKVCKVCNALHGDDTQIKCKIILEVFDELKYNTGGSWNLLSKDERKDYKETIKGFRNTGMLEDFKQEVNKVLKKARKACEEKKNQIQQERKQCAEKIKNLKGWNLLSEEAQEDIIEALERLNTSNQFSDKIKQTEKFIKENYDISDDDELNELISETKKEENWNNFQNLKNLLTQIKSLQTSDFYNKLRQKSVLLKKD